MNFRKILSIIFILVFSTQVLPIEQVNILMKKTADVTMLEELNENHNSSANNNLNEQEHKLISCVPLYFYCEINGELLTKRYFADYILKDINDPFIEMSEIPPNFS